MSITRDNHYVPQWYQARFALDGKNTIAYLDMKPPIFRRRDGSESVGKALHDAPTSRAFFQTDLYSTFFGSAPNDEIERKLFGDIDRRGADALRAFVADDKSAWHANFETLFEYVDIQKLRTPTGLEWLKKQYPKLSQNELMFEMQSIRNMNCMIWMQGVREIVSAKNSETKFIITDTPVTVYNHAAPPKDPRCIFPDDPSIALKGSQTIFPLGPDHCLILTNLEYARDPDTNALEKRIFARNFHNAMVNSIEFAKDRQLEESQVREINFILKSRARRYIGAGNREWLHPERHVSSNWNDLRGTLLPPDGSFIRMGGEMFIGYEGGAVHYQDEFGRSEKPRAYLQKPVQAEPLGHRDICGCGSGLPFGRCCIDIPVARRPTWAERSIRERNLMLFQGISNVLDLEGKDWITVRKEMTDEKIALVYELYDSLWPLETDLLRLLPKPDGRLRARLKTL